MTDAKEYSIGAVSYTHLRAHETVLDLVCRLLLEKKKTKHLNQRTTHNKLHTTNIPTTSYHNTQSNIINKLQNTNT